MMPQICQSGGLMVGCLGLLLAQPALASAAPPTTQLIAQQDDAIATEFANHFEDLGIEGAIAIYDLQGDRLYQHNPDRNATPFLPASTFKILNSLIALETGVIADELAILTWDGIERSIPNWNRDHNLRTAFKFSAVWFYQVVARRVGHERMQQWVTDVEYGNTAIGEPEEIDQFWLEGDLRITPLEQIEFLQRLYRNDLPFSEDVIATVKDIMVTEQTPTYTIRAKTGWAGLGAPDQPQIGWYVGYVEQGENVYFFATSIDIREDADAAARLELTRRCLQTLQVL